MLRLSELLERLRPAGTPGAPTEGEQQRRHELQEREIAAVAAMLREFEADADHVVTAGRAEADRLRRDGDQRVHLIRAQLPDRIAIARAEAVRQHEEHGTTEITHVEHEAEREIARIETDAETRVPQLADAVTTTIWSALTTSPVDIDRHPEQEGGP